MPTDSSDQSSERNFRLLWFAQTSSLIGVQFGVVAIPLVAVVTLNATPFQVGLLTSLSSVAWLAFGLFVGVAVDRLPRKFLIILSHLGRAALLIGVACLARWGQLTIAGLYVIVFAVGMLSMVFETAYQAFLPTISARSQLGARNGKLAVTDGLSRTVGPSSAGYIVQLASAPVAIVVQSFGYLLACLATIGIKPDPGVEVARRESPVRALGESIAFIGARRILRAMLISEVLYLFCFNVTFAVVMVFYVREVGLSPAGVGVVFAAGSIGGIASGVLSMKVTALDLRVHLLLGSSLRAAGLALIPLALLIDDGVMLALAGARFMNSFGWTLWEVRKRTETQLRTPEGMLGRVQGFFLFCSRGSEATGAITGAMFAAALGTAVTVTIGCLAGIASTLVLLCTPRETARDS